MVLRSWTCFRLKILSLAILGLTIQPSSAAEKNVTDFILMRTAVPHTVDREWKRNCPVFFCGSEKEKKATVLQVKMEKLEATRIKVRGIVVAEANFGALNPLDDKQLITVSGEANPIGCTFKMQKLIFSDGVTEFLVKFFSSLEGKVYLFRDARGKCDQYFPRDL